MVVGVTGTVTPYESLISAEEAQKAANRVENLIAEHQKELDMLHHFISDNTNLINLVQKLPDELSHDIMVPFGKAAFFPGQLIHTNEFLVFIGEGYHVQKTSKQTKEFLQRREKLLESKVESLQAMMLDLKAKASFFVDEAAEGIVEIREDYIEEHPTERMAIEAVKPHSMGPKEPTEKISAEDEEYDPIWTIMDKLEKEERDAESINEIDEDQDSVIDSGCLMIQHSIEQKLKISAEQQAGKSIEDSNNKRFYTATRKPLHEDHSQQKNSDLSTFEDLKVQSLPKDVNMHGKNSILMDKSDTTKKQLANPEKKKVHVASTSKFKDPGHTDTHALADSKKIDKDGHSSKTDFDSSKAFTGSIVEHAQDLPDSSKIHVLRNQSPDLRCRKVVGNNWIPRNIFTVLPGTVTPYESLISAEEAQKAANRVENLIAAHQQELDMLHHFISDNTNLINLLQKLPSELSHNIKVLFGKAAFFPGQVFHTNEFLVFIGEGYHVQKTSKQTKEFSQRREKLLESKVEFLQAMMLDLKAKASFFVNEAAEGIVEIREDYIEEHPTERMAIEAGASILSILFSYRFIIFAT